MECFSLFNRANFDPPSDIDVFQSVGGQTPAESELRHAYGDAYVISTYAVGREDSLVANASHRYRERVRSTPGSSAPALCYCLEGLSGSLTIQGTFRPRPGVCVLYSGAVRPLLFRLDPQVVHRWTIALSHQVSRASLSRALVRAAFDHQYTSLALEVLGLRFRNPVGLAAGFDKHAEMYPLVSDLGFGHMEIGSVSLRPWRGNPSPTLLRLPLDYGLINRPGLNSHGSDAVAARLAGATFAIPTGMNLVKTADPQIVGDAAIEDYVQAVSRFDPTSDFITLNLSCPNSAEGRTFEDPRLFETLMAALQRARQVTRRRHPSTLVKLSPDLARPVLDRLLEIAEAYGISGYVIANTTVRRELLKTPRSVLSAFGAGGLSGRPIAALTKPMVKYVASRAGEGRVVIACGGVGCDPAHHPAEEVWEYLTLGATLVQLHTGLIYSGPGLMRRINHGLVQILTKHGIRSLDEYIRNRPRPSASQTS